MKKAGFPERKFCVFRCKFKDMLQHGKTSVSVLSNDR